MTHKELQKPRKARLRPLKTFMTAWRVIKVKYIAAMLCIFPSVLSFVLLLAGERVLCFHGPLLYEAKVCFNTSPPYQLIFNCNTKVSPQCQHSSVCSLFLQCVKINIKEKQIKYFIHYSGWNKKWAAWIQFARPQLRLIWIKSISASLWLYFFFFPAGMNGFLKAEFSNMWTATLRNKKSFKRPISKFL